MISALRIIFVVLLALAALPRGARAASGMIVPGTGAAAPGGLPAWSAMVSVENGYGFKDNLLLSAANEERSAFAQASVETLFLRVPTGPVDYSIFAQAEGRHFFSGRTVHNEASVWLRQELAYRAGSAWRFLLPVTGFFDDKVFDQSDTEVERLTAELKVTGVVAGPTVRWTLHRDWWCEVQATGQRDRYEDRISDSWTRHAQLRVNWTLRPGIDLGVSGTGRRRDFDTRVQYSAAGRELNGTRLKVAEEELVASLTVKWGKDEAWQTTSRAGVLNYRDNGSGYFDHRQRQFEQELEWHGDAWLVRLRGAARRVEFSIQTVGFGLNPTPRVKDEYESALRVERKLTPRWTILGDVSWERARCNDRLASYIVNEGLLGVRWSWEK